MKAIVLPRRGGKTVRMLRWLFSDDRRVLIVHSARERDRLFNLLNLSGGGGVGKRIITLGDVTSGLTRGRWREPVYGIDELDLVLRQLLLGPVEVISFSGELEVAVDEAAERFPAPANGGDDEPQPSFEELIQDELSRQHAREAASW